MGFKKVIGNLPIAGAAVLSFFESVFVTASQALRVEEVDPISEHYVPDTLAEVVDGTDGTYYYYVDMDAFRQYGLQMILNGGSGTITVTIEATIQNDGTAAASCTYSDVTNYVFGVASWTASAFVSDHENKLAVAKYVRAKVVANSGSNDADWTLFHERLY